MNLQNLKYILSIEVYGSMSKAARALFVSQPYLSWILSETEQEYGITIFRREKNRLVVTERGRDFLITAQKTLETVDAFDAQLHALQEDVHLRISSCCTAYIADAYLRFLNQKKDAHLRIHYKETDNHTVIRDIYGGTSEIGFIILSNSNNDTPSAMIREQKLICEKLYSLDMYLITRTGHPLSRLNRPITPEDLQTQSFVFYPRLYSADYSLFGSAHYEYLIDTLDWKMVPKITYVYSRAMYYDLILRTDAVSFGFQTTAEQESIRGLRSLPLDPALLEGNSLNSGSTMYLVRRPDRPLSPLSEEFLLCVRESI